MGRPQINVADIVISSRVINFGDFKLQPGVGCFVTHIDENGGWIHILHMGKRCMLKIETAIKAI